MIIQTPEYTLRYYPGGDLSAIRRKIAPHVERLLRLEGGGDESFMLTVARMGAPWPFLEIEATCRHLELMEPGFTILPREQRLFLGVGNLAAIVDLQDLRTLAIEDPFLFWDWLLLDRLVILTGECLCIAYTRAGKRKWEARVEPPWDIRIEGAKAVLDVMGAKSEFPLESGPPSPTA